MSKRLKTNDYQLTIGWLYSELMSTYGDRGNIIVLQKRCEWRGIDAKVKQLEIGFKVEDLKSCDLLFMGGAQDKQQKIVAEDLQKKAKTLKAMIEDSIPGLYICGAYQFLGKYYKEADGTIINSLGILDLYTENPGSDHPRLIGNIVASLCHPEQLLPCHPELVSGSLPCRQARLPDGQAGRDSDMHQNDMAKTLVGFENHGGRTYLGKKVEPLAKVINGFGNNGADKTEGAIYKNSFGSYMHGPILPKNPHFADYLIKLALEKKYKKEIQLTELDDSLELQAHKTIVRRLGLEV